MEIAERIRELREALKLSQVDLAKKIGVSSGNVGDWERGRAKPGFDALLALSKFFDISIDCLMTGKDPTCLSSTYPDEIVLSRQDMEILPLSDTERGILKKFRKLTQKEQKETRNFIDKKLLKS